MLSKHFGDYQALAEIHFKVFEHEILGLIGPNGSGSLKDKRKEGLGNLNGLLETRLG